MMIFVTANDNRSLLEDLTGLLVSAFPGSTIYQHTDPMRAPHDVMNNKVDAVFIEAEMEKTDGLELTRILHRRRPDIPVFIISKTDACCDAAAEAGAAACLVRPVNEQQLKEALLLSGSRDTEL